MRHWRRLLRKVIRGREICAEEHHFAFDVALEQRLAILVGKLAVDIDGCRSRDRGQLTHLLTSLLEAADRAVQDHEIRSIRGVAVSFAVNVLKAALLLELLYEVFIECHLKFSRQLDLVGLNHGDADGRGLYFRERLVLRPQTAAREECHTQQEEYNSALQDSRHGFCSLASGALADVLSASSFIGTLVRAPCATSSFLSASALPTGIVKMAPCRLPSASRYWIVSVSSLVRKRLMNPPDPEVETIERRPKV